MAFNLFGEPKRRSRSSGGGGGKALDTVILIGGLGILGVGGYFLLRSGKGLEEFQDSAGDALKSLVNAGNSFGDYVADGSYWLQKQLGIGSGGSEETSIVGGLSRTVGGDIAGTKSDIKRTKDKYAATWGPLADVVDSTFDALRGIGCGTLRKC